MEARSRKIDLIEINKDRHKRLKEVEKFEEENVWKANKEKVIKTGTDKEVKYTKKRGED